MGCRVLEGCGGCSGCPGGLGRPSDERPAMIGRGYFSTEASNDCSVGASFPILSRRHRVSELFQLSNFPVPVYFCLTVPTGVRNLLFYHRAAVRHNSASRPHMT